MRETPCGGNWAGPCSVNLEFHFLLMGRAMFPPYCLTWDQTIVEIMKIMATSFKKSPAHTATLSAPNSEAGHICQRLLDTHGQDWVSLLLDHCSFFLGTYAHKFLFLPSKSLFPQSCVTSGSSVLGLMVTSSKRAYATPRLDTQSPCPCSRPLLTHTSPGDTQILKGKSGSVSAVSPDVHKIFFESSESLW